MPGERTPRKVPMMPLADIVALSTSVSNHWSSRSAALMVMSCSRRWREAGASDWNRRSRPRSWRRPRGSSESGSGGTMARMGLTKRAMSTIAFAYSSYASASTGECR